MTITIGTDYELFLQQNKKVIPAWEVLPYPKEKPLDINGFKFHFDNVTAEVATPPTTSLGEFIVQIKRGQKLLKQAINRKDIQFLYKASALFGEEYLTNAYFLEFGCSPDWCVWTETENIVDNSYNLYRAAGGHIHIGHPSLVNNIELMKRYVYALDLRLGVPSVIKDPDKNRRRLYGKAGAFRIKPYGIEYRVLSNFWITKASYITWVFDVCERELNTLLYDLDYNDYILNTKTIDTIIATINDSDVVSAKTLCKELSIYVP